ncbi:MAG: ATP-binding protein, partial [Flavobacteriales bacterium]
ANELLLRTAFRNLLANAAAYSPDHRIGIELVHAPGVLLAHFSNAGDQELPTDRLFQPFFRGPGRDGTPGSGLGLSIVQQIAEHAGGGLSYTYKGSHCFELTLPLAV